MFFMFFFKFMSGYVGLCLCQVSCNVYAGECLCIPSSNEVLLKVVFLEIYGVKREELPGVSSAAQKLISEWSEGGKFITHSVGSGCSCIWLYGTQGLQFDPINILLLQIQ